MVPDVPTPPDSARSRRAWLEPATALTIALVAAVVWIGPGSQCTLTYSPLASLSGNSCRTLGALTLTTLMAGLVLVAGLVATVIIIRVRRRRNDLGRWIGLVAGLILIAAGFAEHGWIDYGQAVTSAAGTVRVFGPDPADIGWLLVILSGLAVAEAGILVPPQQASRVAAPPAADPLS